MRQKRKTAVNISFTAVYYLILSDVNHQLFYESINELHKLLNDKN